MLRFIHGKCYNTTTATKIAEWSRDYTHSSVIANYRWKETLYQTAKGKFFVAVEGNAMSRWRPRPDQRADDGSGIRPLSNIQAQRWCAERNVDLEIINKHFAIDKA